MAVDEIHEGDIGTSLEVTVKDGALAIDISSATTKDIFLEKPDGTVLTKAGVFVTDGSDGKVKYDTVDGDLDTVGNWRIQVHIVTANGEWKSDIETFQVHANLA